MTDALLKRTPLHALHVRCGAKLAPFAGYELPVQFVGILAEHRHTREAVSLFDVSHMGQMVLNADGSHGDVAALLEELVPGDIKGLAPGATRYTLLLGDSGGILDDLMVSRPRGERCRGALFMVVNGATKEADAARIEAELGGRARLERLEDRALVALQGPSAASVFSEFAPEVAGLKFMEGRRVSFDGTPVFVTRSGYTGEDGFEISIPGDKAIAVADALLNDARVKPAGLGARDSLRLEAGLCLYGHDIAADTDPVEAGLSWTIGARRRMEANFPGAPKILSRLETGTDRLRVGLRPEGRVVARDGTEILDGAEKLIGRVTSGTFGPTVDGPIAMGYVARKFAAPGTKIKLRIRGRTHGGEIVALPFVPHRYFRG